MLHVFARMSTYSPLNWLKKYMLTCMRLHADINFFIVMHVLNYNMHHHKKTHVNIQENACQYTGECSLFSAAFATADNRELLVLNLDGASCLFRKNRVRLCIIAKHKSMGTTIKSMGTILARTNHECLTSQNVCCKSGKKRRRCWDVLQNWDEYISTNVEGHIWRC